jgi:hypothetical protein
MEVEVPRSEKDGGDHLYLYDAEFPVCADPEVARADELAEVTKSGDGPRNVLQGGYPAGRVLGCFLCQQ